MSGRTIRAVAGGLALGVAIAACSRATGIDQPPDDRAVYAAVLLELYDQHLPDRLVALDSTATFPDPRTDAEYRAWLTRDGGPPLELLESLASLSRTRIPIHRLPLPRPVIAVPAAEWRAMFRDNPNAGWAEFHHRYPGARYRIVLSPAAFDAPRGQAAVFVRRGCGPRCGMEALIWLVRDAKAGWEVKRVLTLSTS